MKIGLTELTKIIDDCKDAGFEPKMHEIAYVCLLNSFKDKSVVYKIFFGSDAKEKEIEAFDSCEKISFLKKYIADNYIGNSDLDDKYSDITFEDNKEAMIKMIDEAERKYKNNEIEWDKYSDRVSKLRIALNDKFKVSEKQDEQRIIVYAKYDAICPYCHHEVKSKPAEEAIKEIKEKYELIPKNSNTTDNN